MKLTQSLSHSFTRERRFRIDGDVAWECGGITDCWIDCRLNLTLLLFPPSSFSASSSFGDGDGSQAHTFAAAAPSPRSSPSKSFDPWERAPTFPSSLDSRVLWEQPVLHGFSLSIPQTLMDEWIDGLMDVEEVMNVFWAFRQKLSSDPSN